MTYPGEYESIDFAEETRHPTRQLTRAMFGGLALAAGIYLLLNAALPRALGPAGLAASKFAAADAARLIFGRASEIHPHPVRSQPRWPVLAARRPGRG